MSTMKDVTLAIDGMHCDHCVDRVRDALAGIEGVSVQTVRIGRADVRCDPSSVSQEHLAAALDKAGYELSTE